MEAVYGAVTGKLTRVTTHEAFMRSWAYVEDTQTRSGENPLLSWYKNASGGVTGRIDHGNSNNDNDTVNSPE
ncbi:hypothetical protein DL763_002917 [Monosporascus cannonballus]|nr:hypothetical protein DL763_002917 [Monosporascus cannonballus]